jgi:hypothetical protein
MFNLGNFAVKEIIFDVAQNFNEDLLYTLDQLTNASIEVSSDPTDITDKNGNVIRSIYQSKTATFTASSALLSPVLMNAQSGSAMEEATEDNPIDMPFIAVVAAGGTVDVSAADVNTIHVMGLYSNGANGKVLTQSTTAATVDATFLYDAANKIVTVPAQNASGTAPTKYLVKYDYSSKAGYKLSNSATTFPDTIRLTLYAAIMDPCSDTYRAAYIYIPSFQPDPSVTINLDSENTETDYNGNIMVDYCDSENKELYYIYFPDADAVTSVVTNVPAVQA